MKFSHGDWTGSVAWLAKGLVVSSGADGVVRAWSTRGALRHELRDPGLRAYALGSATTPKHLARDGLGLGVAFSPDGEQLVFAGPPALQFHQR